MKIFKIPFAATGDKIAIPVVEQPSGEVSQPTGWTPDYQLPNTDPNYKPVGRDEMNGVLFEITEALGQLQQFGFADWQNITGGWPIGANVNHGGGIWQSLANANVEEPGTGALWKPILFDNIAQATESIAGLMKIATTAQAQALTADTTALTPAKLASVTATETRAGLIEIATNTETQTGTDTVRAVTPAGLASLKTSSPTDTTAGRLLKVGDGGWMNPIGVTPGSDLNDYIFPGRYSCGVDLIVLGLTNSPTVNAFDLDVRKSGANGSGVSQHLTQYNSNLMWFRTYSSFAWTPWVEIYHTGNVSSFAQTLLDDADAAAAKATLQIIEPVGVGQTWQDVTGSRAKDTTYTNTTGRSIVMSVVCQSDAGNPASEIFVNNVRVGFVSDYGNSSDAQMTAVVPSGATYKVGTSGIITIFAELR